MAIAAEVVTHQGRTGTVDLCSAHEDETARYIGVDYYGVAYGLHYGVCQACEDDSRRRAAEAERAARAREPWQVTASWAPGEPTTRRFASASAAEAAAEAVVTEPWNRFGGGALVMPPTGKGWWVR